MHTLPLKSCLLMQRLEVSDLVSAILLLAVCQLKSLCTQLATI
jgi:hypothetical protein